MDLFKLIFQHDIRLDQLRGRHVDRDTQETSNSLEAFLKPDPTYSKFYFSGTVLAANPVATYPGQPRFGLSCLDHADDVISAIEWSLSAYTPFATQSRGTLSEMIHKEPIGSAILLKPVRRDDEPTQDDGRMQDLNQLLQQLSVGQAENAGHKKEAIASTLEENQLVLYKETAHDGFDLHLFSKKNLYREFFTALKPLVSDNFRFFSMNGKRITSERKFYFETWALSQPPHGIEEVFPETVL
jgi:hypothetical protein